MPVFFFEKFVGFDTSVAGFIDINDDEIDVETIKRI